MSDKIPGSSYDNPIWHRGWRIYASYNPVDGDCQAYVHDDFDGADDSTDSRHGYARSVEAAKAAIDHHEQEALIEQFEAGDMGDVEFTELALELGMDMADIEKALQDRHTADLIEEEDEAEERAANGQFGVGA